LSPDREFSLGALGRKHTLTRHTPETFSRHSQANKALALIPEAQRSRITHFVEEVELPADAVGIHLVTYPNSIPELALAFIHIPIAAKRSHFRQKRKGSGRKPHATFNAFRHQPRLALAGGSGGRPARRDTGRDPFLGRRSHHL
jgi:hypothetical protein